MTLIISTTLAYLLLYKYVTLFAVAYLAALLLPLPSNTSLLAASAFASQGYLNMYIVFFVAFLANVLGDVTGFVIARKYGKEFLLKVGFRKIMESEKYEKMERFIVRNSAITIFVTRFFGGIGPLVNILTGLSKNITFKKFIVYDIAGEFVYVMSLSLSGYFLGTAWQNITISVELVSAIVLVSVLFFAIKRLFFHKHHVVQNEVILTVQ